MFEKRWTWVRKLSESLFNYSWEGKRIVKVYSEGINRIIIPNICENDFDSILTWFVIFVERNSQQSIIEWMKQILGRLILNFLWSWSVLRCGINDSRHGNLEFFKWNLNKYGLVENICVLIIGSSFSIIQIDHKFRACITISYAHWYWFYWTNGFWLKWHEYQTQTLDFKRKIVARNIYFCKDRIIFIVNHISDIIGCFLHYIKFKCNHWYYMAYKMWSCIGYSDINSILTLDTSAWG